MNSPNGLWFLTLLNSIEPRKLMYTDPEVFTWGYFSEKASAVAAANCESASLYRAGLKYAVIEQVEEGIVSPKALQRFWYEFDPGADSFREIHAPDGYVDDEIPITMIG